MEHADEIDVETSGIAAGGAGVARLVDGMVVFVDGALPGERVRVHIDERRRRHGRGHVLEVLDASPLRVPSPCLHGDRGCGGCDWLHVAPSGQEGLRAAIVRDALERIGRLEVPEIRVGEDSAPGGGHRTTVRAAVAGGRAGIRHRGSHEPVRHDSCLVAHPLVEEVLVDGRFGDASGVVIRAGARTGERMVIVSPRAEEVSVPSDVVVVGDDELRAGRRVWIHEEVAGRRWRISGRSFFQSNPAAADHLVEIVAAAVAGAGPGALVDLYAGVGLFAGTVGDGREVVAVERSASSVADLRVNLAGRSPAPTIVRVPVEDWTASPAGVVVADPAREGLGKAGARAVLAAAAGRIVLVSCDAGALGRDARLLVDGGYRLVSVELVGMFGFTSNVEVVTVFDRLDPGGD
ncbi:MAG: TRAM domain-containing protein [Acidimicrobiales bacterium]